MADDSGRDEKEQAPLADEQADDQAPPSLADAVGQMKSRFSEELSGPRQATRMQLVDFLASSLQVVRDTADRVLQRLQESGAVTRQANDQAAYTLQRWTIRDDAERKAEFEAIEQAEIPPRVAERSSEFQAAEDLLERAIAARATDLHLDPYDDEVEVRFRIDGRLEHYCRLSSAVAGKIVTQLKLMGEIDVAEPFEPQAGHLDLPPSLAGHSARLTVVPVSGGEAVAVRLLHREQMVRPLSALGLSEAQQHGVGRLVQRNEGLVLVTGPTGSGKTTTLYSLLHALDNGHRNLVTIEDPVEFRIPAFLQMEVDLRHDVSIARALKTALRLDPDVLMLGEIRDREAMDIALRAADTGTYVLSTVHARDAASVLTAMRDLEVDDRSLANNLRAVISQRMVRRLCETCKSTRKLSDDERAQFARAGLDPPDELWEPAGCDRCRQTGYYDRIGVFEMFENNAQIAAAIHDGVSEADFRRLLRESDVTSLAVDALKKVAAGIISLEAAEGMAWVAPATGGDSDDD